MKTHQEYKDGSVRLNAQLFMESSELAFDKYIRKEDGDLVGYWFDDKQQELLANILNSRVQQYFRENFDKLLADAKEYVGQGHIVNE
jgi:hypothetical protein